MAWTLTVDSVDITLYVDITTLVGEEVASQEQGRTATLKFIARDHTGTIEIEPEDAVSLVESGTDYFIGKVKEAVDDLVGVTRTWKVTCADNNCLLDETTVEDATIDAGDDDDAEIGTIFGAYRPDIDGSTYVTQLEADMPQLVLDGMTLREALDAICEVTGGRYYVDFAKALHYFAGSESNSAAFSLSDAPNGSTSFGYSNLNRARSSVMMANRFFIQGDTISGWVTGASYSAGDPEGALRDSRITDAAHLLQRGTQLLDRYEGERISFDLETYKDGLQAGMDVTLIAAAYSINASYTIRKVRWQFADVAGTKRLYHLYLNDEDWSGTAGQARITRTLRDVQNGVGDLDGVVFDDDAPSAPSFTAGNLSTGTTIDPEGHFMIWIKATWGIVSDADLDHYEIQIADSAAFNWPQIQHVQAGDTREVIWGALIGNTDYYLRVRAVDWVGNYSAWSPSSPGYLVQTTALDTTPPAQVAGLSAAASRTLIGLSWTANTDADMKTYRIARAPDVTGSPGSWLTIAQAYLNYYIDEDFSDAEIAAEDTFWYRVRAVDRSGNAGDWSAETSATLSRITADHIAALTITAAQIAANTITAGQIAANTITAGQIAASTITADRLSVSTLSAIAADMGTLTAGEIRVGTGTVGSNFTGFRIMSSYIGGYNTDVLQAGIRTSDGKLIAGGGAVTLDEDGIVISLSTTLVTEAGITWYSPYLTDVAFRLEAMDDSSKTYFQLVSNPPTGEDVEIVLEALSYDTQTATATLMAISGGTGGVVRCYGNNATAGDSVYLNPVVYINDTANAFNTAGLTINQGGADDEALTLKNSDVAHGMTDLAETDTVGVLMKRNASYGGLYVVGYREDSSAAAPYEAISLAGRLGEAADTTKSTAGKGVINLIAQVKSAATVTTVGTDGNLVTISNSATTRFIFDAEGSAHGDVEWAAFDEHDDLALLDRIERTLIADQVGGEFGAFVEENKTELERLNIAHFDDQPGHAMINWTRLSMLLVGALRQTGRKLASLEARLEEGICRTS